MRLKLTIPPAAKIRSWKDLLYEATALREDAGEHGYSGWRSNGRKYCANVKVHNCSGDLQAAIKKLNVSDPEIIETLEEDFGEDAVESLYQEWIESSSEYLHEWFEGAAHDSSNYFDELQEKVESGVSTQHPELESIQDAKTKLALIKSWRDENALFKEALDCADDDSLVWEGRSSGYITWNATEDVERMAWDVEKAAESRYMCFSEALELFRSAEKHHRYNLALIAYLEDWARSMSFQDELDYIVMQRFDEIGGTSCKVDFETHGDLVVTIHDSIEAGNCMSGTVNWIAEHIPGRDSATIRELMAFPTERAILRRLCRMVIRKHETTRPKPQCTNLHIENSAP